MLGSSDCSGTSLLISVIHVRSESTFFLLRPLTRRAAPKQVVYMCVVTSSAFVVEFPSSHKATNKSAAEPRYMTFEAQNFLLNKDTWLCTLTFGTCGGGTAGCSCLTLLIPKLYFEAKHARIHSIIVPMILLHLEFCLFLKARGAPLMQHWTVDIDRIFDLRGTYAGGSWG